MLRIITVCLVANIPGLVFAASPWLPEPGSSNISFSYIDESFDEFFRGGADAQLPADIEQSTLSMIVEYGLSDSVSLDIKTGYTETSFAPASRGNFSGRDDSLIGIRWRIRDEFIGENTGLSVAIRLAAIVAGDYESSSPGNPHSPGDSASGFQASVILGKVMQSWAYSLELGYKDREEPVANDLLVNLDVYYWLNSQWTLTAGYVLQEAQDGVDIGDPGINPSRFDELKEISDTIRLGVAYKINNKVNIGVDIAKTVGGRNTGKKDVNVIYLGYSF